MKNPRRRLCALTCFLSCVLGFSLAGVGRADAPSMPKPAASVLKNSQIPLRVLQDIRRVHPGMTRADLDWLFTPDGGLSMVSVRSYLYRYAGAVLAAVDAAGKPVLDKVTHKPVEIAQAIKIDVKFRPAMGRSWAMVTEDKTALRYISPDGRPDDVIVSVSDPYVGFQNDN